MKRFVTLIIIVTVLTSLVSCHSKKNVVAHESNCTDTIYIEKQHEDAVQSSIDWRSLGFSFDSIVVVTEPTAAQASLQDSLVCSPYRGYRTTFKAFGGALNHTQSSHETLSTEYDMSVEMAACSKRTKDYKEDSETKAVTDPSSISKWIAAILAMFLIGLTIKFICKKRD